MIKQSFYVKILVQKNNIMMILIFNDLIFNNFNIQ